MFRSKPVGRVYKRAFCAVTRKGRWSFILDL